MRQPAAVQQPRLLLIKDVEVVTLWQSCFVFRAKDKTSPIPDAKVYGVKTGGVHIIVLDKETRSFPVKQRIQQIQEKKW